MRLSEIRDLVRIGTPDPPYGVRALARCYDIDDLARLARKRLPAGAADYLDGGGEDEWTLRRNREVFGEVEFTPRQLLDVSQMDTEATVLGTRMPLPIVLSPIGGPRMFHSDGELAVARAARHARLPYGISTLATQSLEAIAEAAQGNPLWFQLYVWGDRSMSRELIRRARDAGYRALLLSVDTSVRSERDRELHRGIKLPSPDLTVGTMLDGARHPSWSWHFLTSPAIGFPNLSTRVSMSREMFEQMFDGTICWQDLKWIRQEWDGPIAVKGMLRAEDAIQAADHGVDAIIVSNHGGRQMDHVPATLEVLPDIVAAVGDRMDVLFDSGIRRGSDIVTALSLGARAVLIGRAHLYGLAAAGEAGVRHAIDILSTELRITMALCGVKTLADLSPDLLRARGLPQLDGLPHLAPERALPGRSRPPAGQLAPRT
jgi:L-lactate dehydrogenase (cytochrome)